MNALQFINDNRFWNDKITISTAIYTA